MLEPGTHIHRHNNFRSFIQGLMLLFRQVVVHSSPRLTVSVTTWSNITISFFSLVLPRLLYSATVDERPRSLNPSLTNLEKKWRKTYVHTNDFDDELGLSFLFSSVEWFMALTHGSYELIFASWFTHSRNQKTVFGTNRRVNIPWRWLGHNLIGCSSFFFFFILLSFFARFIHR